jgi:diaminohydroxyphosphoribosylaminopyrimidine deaminase / 5-amino-6-(5-phosphoribosylamino)uracil reductase
MTQSHTRSTDQDDAVFMARAIELAESCWYVPAPNPRVGCVFVRDGQIVAEGVTQAAGQAHAEVMALRDLLAKGQSAQGTTVYVSLEPCSHHGKTPPCTDALIQARPDRVVIAHVDPNPEVAGQGIARLRAAGIEVTLGVLATEALEINPGFVSRMIRSVPYVWLKVAASMDLQTALASGESQWITGELARADGHHWRARSCLVLTGIGTVKADDPQLNVRAVQTPRAPRRGVIDPKLEIDAQAQLLQTPGLLLFAANPDPARVADLNARGAQVVNLPEATNPDRVDLPAMMRWLALNDINEVHVEAGAGLNGALWQAGCVDELLIYIAPVFIGAGHPMLRLPGIDKLDEAGKLSFIDSAQIGSDIRVRARAVDRWARLHEHIAQHNERIERIHAA